MVPIENIPMLFEKANKRDAHRRLIEYFQVCVKDGVGIGKQIVTDFLAPVNPECPEEYISYSQELNKYPDEFYLV